MGFRRSHLLPAALPALSSNAVAQCPDQWLATDPAFKTNGRVYSLIPWDPDGPGPQAELLIVAGSFSLAGTTPAANIAAWNGTQWLTFGAGINGRVEALAVLNGELFAAGSFSAAGSTPAQNVAAWNGSSWRALDLPVYQGLGVSSLAVYQGSLYAALNSLAGSLDPLYRRVGSEWIEIAPQLPCLGVSEVVVYGDSLVVGGAGPYWTTACVVAVAGPPIPEPAFTGEYQYPVLWGLYADAPWLVATGNLLGFSAICDGQSWAIPFFLPPPVSGLSAVADFHGQAIVGGGFTRIGATEAANIARWNGVAAFPMGSGITGSPGYIVALRTWQDRVIVGGFFTSAGGLPVSNLALWGPAPACYPNCDCSSASPLLNASDFTCFLNRYAASDPYANCDQSTASPTLNVADFICFMNKYAAGCP